MDKFYYENGDTIKDMQISDIMTSKEYVFMSKGYVASYYELCFIDNTKLIITPMLVFDLSKIINIRLVTERTHMFNILL